MRTFALIVSVPLLILDASSCTGAPNVRPRISRQETVQQKRECFGLRQREWSQPIQEYYRTITQVPNTIDLDTIPLPGRDGAYGHRELSPPIPTLKSVPGLTPSYRRPTPDSLMLTWSNGFAGVFVRLAARGDSLFGEAQPVSDRIGEAVTFARASVVGWRVPCPAT
jgi:hypothetical protein